MAVVAGVHGHIREAEALMSKAHDTLSVIEEKKFYDMEQMQTDIAAVGSLSSLAQAHIQMAHFLQFRNDS